MIPLHTIGLAGNIIWPLMPCTSSYHNGYNAERTSAAAHHECLRPDERLRRNTRTGDIWFCECQMCYQPENAHYYWVDQDNYHIRYTPAGAIYCWECRDGRHPRR